MLARSTREPPQRRDDAEENRAEPGHRDGGEGHAAVQVESGEGEPRGRQGADPLQEQRTEGDADGPTQGSGDQALGENLPGDAATSRPERTPARRSRGVVRCPAP